jgi:orotate phosphoribosyltransferase
MDERDELLRLIARESILFNEEGFRLASGKVSNWYYDVKRTTLSFPHALMAAARLILARIEAIKPPVQAVGGLTSGADPLVVAIGQVALQGGVDLPGFFVRDAAKAHGTERLVEGALSPGMDVVIVDDVITEGKSVYKAIKGAESEGARVVHVFILVDREEGGAEFLRSKGYKIDSIFTHSELIPFARRSG